VSPERTQVGIVGAGPAGLMLARLLELEGIDTVVLEDRSRDYVEQRIRAGVLEQRTADLLVDSGVGERLQREGIVHHGIELQFEAERHRIPLSELAGGRAIVIYGQTEVVKDLIAARLDSGLPLLFEVEEVSLHELESEGPRVRFRHGGQERDRCRARPHATARVRSAGAAACATGRRARRSAGATPKLSTVRCTRANATLFIVLGS